MVIFYLVEGLCGDTSQHEKVLAGILRRIEKPTFMEIWWVKL